MGPCECCNLQQDCRVGLTMQQCCCRISIESSRPRARLQSEGLNSILMAIGTTLNTPDPAGRKAMWLPSQKARFLGMYVDAANQRFILPEEKKQDITLTASMLLEASTVSNRQLAQLAGKNDCCSSGSAPVPLVG